MKIFWSQDDWAQNTVKKTDILNLINPFENILISGGLGAVWQLCWMVPPGLPQTPTAHGQGGIFLQVAIFLILMVILRSFEITFNLYFVLLCNLFFCDFLLFWDYILFSFYSAFKIFPLPSAQELQQAISIKTKIIKQSFYIVSAVSF